MDSGYEGPQSALNNFDDFCSIAGVEGYSFTKNEDARRIISSQLIKPGFRILSTGQRILREDVLELEALRQDDNCKYLQYKKGGDVSIVCFNLALLYGLELHKVMLNQGIKSSLFSINFHLYENYNFIIEDIKRTRRLVIIDDSKSRNRLSDRFLSEVLSGFRLKSYKILSRQPLKDDFFPR